MIASNPECDRVVTVVENIAFDLHCAIEVRFRFSHGWQKHNPVQLTDDDTEPYSCWEIFDNLLKSEGLYIWLPDQKGQIKTQKYTMPRQCLDAKSRNTLHNHLRNHKFGIISRLDL